MIKKVFALFLLALVSNLAVAQTARNHWVDSVYKALNANARIGQLFMIPVGSNPDDQAINEIENRIKSHDQQTGNTGECRYCCAAPAG